MSLLLLWKYFLTLSTVPMVDFEQVIICTEWQFKSLHLYVDQWLVAIMSLQIHIIHWKKSKRTHRKMFSQTTYREQDSINDHLALVKTNLVSKYTLSEEKLRYPWHNYKGSSKKYYPFIILVMSSKNESINLKLPKYRR